MSPDTQIGKGSIAPLTLPQREAIRLANYLDLIARRARGEVLPAALDQILLERSTNPGHCTDKELQREQRGGY